MNNIARRILFTVSGLLVLTLIVLNASQASAQNWSKFHDEDNIFHVLIPENYKLNKKMLRMNDEHMLITTELNSQVDQRPYKDVLKQYIIKYDQTFMNAIPKEDIPDLLDKEIERYIKFYAKQEGVLRNKEFGTFNGLPGGDIFISYRDKDRGIQSIRVRIMYSDVSRVEQIIMGPEDSMNANTTKDYFSSLRVNNGRTKFKGDIEKEWDATISPFALFTQLAPKRAEPYMKVAAKTVANERIERMNMKFFDPVYNNELFYNVYGYRFNTLMTMENVQKVILDRHLKKFKIDPASVKFTQTNAGDYPVLMTKAHFKSPDKYPYMNTISIRAHYYGNFVVIQEMAGNNAHVESILAQNLLRYFRFYPMRGHKKLLEDKMGVNLTPLQKKAPVTPATPIETTTPVPQKDNAASEDTSDGSDDASNEDPFDTLDEAADDEESLDASEITNSDDAAASAAQISAPQEGATSAPLATPASSGSEDTRTTQDKSASVPANKNETAPEPNSVLSPRPEITPLIPAGAIDAGAGR